MTKPKNSFFAIATTMIMLFILGNWVTSAEATSTRTVDATPVPTIMPMETPPGVVPSAEEQQVLKAIVQSYIEVRYRAISVLDSEDFKQNSFGNLISETPKSAEFLREEMGKLAVEVKHAKLDHLRYVNYKVFLDFRSITVDPSTQIATIVVSEGNQVVYEISAELNPENPIISNTAGIEHTIVLHKNQSQWKIVSDTYNDDLWRMLRQLGTSTDEILRATDEIIRTMKAAPRPSLKSNNVETAPAYVMPDDPSSHDYFRAGAVEYALSYWGVVEGEYTHPEGYNHDYTVYSGVGGDCQNFVSQALYEGGNASMYIPDELIPSPPLTTDGQMGWFYLNDMQRASAWAGVDDFYSTVITLGNFALAGNDFYGEGPEGVDITLPQNDQVPPELDLGDVIQYDWGKNGTWDHAAIVVDIEGGLPYVAAHTDDHRRVPYTLQTNTNYRFIHIERSNGNRPVKAKIEATNISGTLSDNDAGPNPLSPYACAFSLGYPEIYFGLCLNGSNIASGFRFNNIQVPQNAQIKYAYLTFSVDGTFTDLLDMKIYGENTANSLIFTNTSQPKDRSFTASVPWPIIDEWKVGNRRTTPNLKSIVDSIVAIPGPTGWQSGNSLSFIFKDPGPTNTSLRRVISFERASWDQRYGPLFPAKLIAAYELGDVTTPTVLSSMRASTNPTNATSVDFAFTFTESVTGVDVTDFTPNTTGVTGAAVSGVTGSGTTYTVTVNTGTGNGTIRLDLIDNDSILDATLNPLGGTGTGNGDFTTGEVYTVDKIPPSVVSSIRANPNPTNLSSVNFTVTFSEAVTGVDVTDFTLSVTGGTGTSVSSVSGSGSVYTVSVYTGLIYDGTIRLDVIDNDSILDAGLSPLGGAGTGNGNFTTGEVYTVDKTITLNLKSIGVNDGWVLESTETSGVGGSLNNTATTFILGDDAANKQYRAILHFDTFSLPDWVVVTSATIKIQQQGQVGSNPFNVLGSLAVDIRKPYFSSSVGLTNNDFQAAASQASVGTFNETPVGAWYSVVLNAAGISNINLTGTTQFRLRFTTDDNNDLGADYFTFISGDAASAANRPQLIIKYFIPNDSPSP